VRAQARKELEAEQAAAAAENIKPELENPSAFNKSTSAQQDPAQLAATGIFFSCPLIGKYFLVIIILVFEIQLKAWVYQFLLDSV
jgi:hypothetical protein